MSIRIDSPLKVFIRISVAVFCAAFGALVTSASTCPRSIHGPFAPAWAPWVCEQNVWRQWVAVAPAIFLVTLFLLGERFRPFRRYAAIALLAFFGVYALSDASVLLSWWAALPIIALVAAFGVLVSQRWARYLVYLLTFVFVVYWGFWTWLAFNNGYFSDSPPGVAILSLAPGVAFMLAAAFCCYVVTKQGPPSSLGSGAGGE